MNSDFLRLEGVNKSFSGVEALRGVSLSIEPGKIYCLVGENGSAKSTLIKVVAGVYPPDGGDIAIDGRIHKRLQPIESIHAGIQVIFQDFSLFPNLTVAENIALNQEISSNRRLVRWGEVKRTATRALGKINVKLDLNALAGDLAVADRQLIAIAKALLENARLIIMDEPTTALTQIEVRSLFNVINRLKQDGIAILFVSHKLDEVLQIADQVFVMRNGEKVLDQSAAGLDRATLARFMTGRTIEFDESQSASEPDQETVVLQVRGLTRAGAFSDISLDLHVGEILGITGLLGSGRTGLALALFGMLKPEAGEVTVRGKTARLESVPRAVRSGIGYVPEDRLTEGLFLTQAIDNNLVICIVDSLRGRFRLLDRGMLRRSAVDWVNRLRILASSVRMPVSSLSGGNQQRVVLAKWLAREPSVLILNGPTVGVDVGSKVEIHEIIRELGRRGMALLVISDDVPELMSVCHRILLMRHGRIVEEFSRSEFTEEAINRMLVLA